MISTEEEIRFLNYFDENGLRWCLPRRLPVRIHTVLRSPILPGVELSEIDSLALKGLSLFFVLLLLIFIIPHSIVVVGKH